MLSEYKQILTIKTVCVKNDILSSFTPPNEFYGVFPYVIVRGFSAIYEQIDKGGTLVTTYGAFIAMNNKPHY